uniref:proteoglycan 4 isoform X3 n=1 Tax=Myodes glareolus TaxID=447135 RepID=UPI0020225A4C|nr:proteoglycan 4 isoform X3 [Myodes glareolus]
MGWKILPICLSLLLPAFLIQQVSSQELSCKGRCFESFQRGRECDCDSQCKEFGKCCDDYESFCEEEKDNKKPPAKKEPNPEPPVVDEAGSGQDNGEPKLTPAPDKPTTPPPKTTTAAKPASAKPSLAPNSETSKEASSASNTETVVETKETTATNKQTSASKKEKTTSAKEIRSAEDKDAAPTSPTPTTSENSAPTTTKKPVPTTTKEPAPTTTKKPVTTTKEPTPTTPQKPEPTPKELAPTTPKEPEPTTPKEPAPTTPKEPEPTTPKEPAPTTPKEPEPTTPKEPAPTTSKEPASTTPKTPAEVTPEFPEAPTPKALENSPKEPTVPPTKTPEVSKPEMTTAAKEKTTEKDPPKTTTVAPKTTIKPEETTESEASATTQVKPTTSPQITTLKTVAPKVTVPAEETPDKPEETTPASEDPDAPKTTLKPQKPTKAPKKPTSTKKPTKAPKKPASTKKPKTKKEKNPKPTPSALKMAPAGPERHTTPLEVAVLPTTASPKHTPDSETARADPDHEDADGGEEGKPLVIPRPPVLSPIVIPGTDHLAGTLNHGISTNPMLSDETNLCNGKPVDGLTTLRNGTLVAFRGHYFWMLNPFRPPSPPRLITEVWGIPSPIDTVFTRCNCEGKTFFFKDSQYWRFTNDVQDAGYPKQIVKGFGGLTGKIVAALSIAKHQDRPESVYFFKRGGSVQQYTYKHEPVRKCTGRRPAINYSVYGQAAQVRRRRFERAVGPFQTHTVRVHYSLPMRVVYQDKGFLHNEVKVSTMWRGFPNIVTSAITLPNIRKPDGYDYYAFSKDQYYNIDVPTRTARAITTRSGQTLSKAWYNCP